MGSAKVAPARAAEIPRWTTPQLFRFSLFLIWFMDVVFLFAVTGAVHAHRDAMKTVGRDTATNIIAAQHIKSAIAAMDVDGVNALLAKGKQTTVAAEAYESDREEASTALLAAAQNISYADEMRRQLRILGTGIGSYAEMIQHARDLRERSDPQFLNVYQQAATLVDDKLYRAADEIDKLNRDVLDRVYRSGLSKSQATRAAVLIGGLALIAVMLMVQSFLNNRTRRTLNPALLAATAAAVIIMLYTNTALSDEISELRVAKQDAFESLHVLWRARALAYEARADQGRSVLDEARAEQYEQAFEEKTNAIRSKYLAAELNNITFNGEGEAANEASHTFEVYAMTESQIQALRQTGKKDAAMTLFLSTDWAFVGFDKALGKTLDINQREFDRAVQKGDEALARFETKIGVTCGIIALFGFWGLWKRIQEYQ